MKENRLGKENIIKLCLIMGIPSVLAQLVNLLYNIVDRIYIGNMPNIGNDALAGLGLCAPIITLIAAFSAFVSGGGAPLAARSLGEQDSLKANKYLSNGLTLLLIFSILLSIITYLFMDDILFAIGASENTFGYASSYLKIYLIGTIFVQISVGLNTFITAQGKSSVAMISVLIGAILNIGLDPLFIFTFNMGIEGAALATIISQAVSCVWVLAFLFNKKNSLHIEGKLMRLEKKIVLGTLSLGIASFVMSATESVIGFVLNKGLKDYGGDIYVSLLAVLQSAMLLLSVPVAGFTQGITPILSYNFGARNKKRVKETFKVNLFFCMGYCILLTSIMMIFPRIFGRMFTSDEYLLSLTVKMLPIFICGMLIFGIQRACQATFVALGEAKISLFIAILRKIILLVPLAIILPKFLGVEGIYYSEPIADCTAAIICGIIFFFRFRSIMSKMPDELPN